MKKLTTSSSNQHIKIIPRTYVSGSTVLKVRDDSLNKEFSFTVTPSIVDDYLQITNAYIDNGTSILVEGRTYDLELYDSSSNIIYKDKIFCTDQAVNQATGDYYTINEGQFTYDSTAGSHDKEYIII
tara:strand:+ start:155 stop:535 length:381 start_codon:yes stop_codon:yes gene_type:complete